MRFFSAAILCASFLSLAGAQGGAGFSPEALAAFSGTRASRAVAKGENLQRIAEAAYGERLYWPIVWIENLDQIQDPERVSEGVLLRVPALSLGAGGVPDRGAVARALDEAYRLVYTRYRSIQTRTAGERRWVLLQAAESGVDIRIWEADLLAADAKWAGGIVPNRPVAALTSPERVRAASEAALLSASRSSAADQAEIEGFFDSLSRATPVPVSEIERFVARIPEARLGEFSERLERELAKERAAPQVAFALAFTRGRMGLKAGEYAALVLAEEKAARRPDVVFNLLAVHGRKALIESSSDWEAIRAAFASTATSGGEAKPDSALPGSLASKPGPLPASTPSIETASVGTASAARADVRTRRFLDVSGPQPRGYYSIQEFRVPGGYRQTSQGYDGDDFAYHEILTDASFRQTEYVYRREDQKTDMRAVLRNGSIVVSGTYQGTQAARSYPTNGRDWVLHNIPYFEAMTKEGVASRTFIMLLVDQPGGLQTLEYEFHRVARERVTVNGETRDAWKIHWGLVGIGALFWPGSDHWHDATTGEFLKGVMPMPGKGTITFVEERR